MRQPATGITPNLGNHNRKIDRTMVQFSSVLCIFSVHRTELANTTAPANSNPFASLTGGRGNLFNRPQTITNDDHEALTRSLGYYPLQPNTPEGINAWQQQLQDWRVRNGDGLITAATGFPLHPGGAVNSHERTFCTISAAFFTSGLSLK